MLKGEYSFHPPPPPPPKKKIKKNKHYINIFGYFLVEQMYENIAFHFLFEMYVAFSKSLF